MARARNIKPKFFTSMQLVELGFDRRLLFAGLWTLADREGRLEDRPKQIKMDIFPADNVDVDKALDELHRAELILRYAVAGKRYIQIIKFLDHQNPHHQERPSTIPKPEISTASQDSKNLDSDAMTRGKNLGLALDLCGMEGGVNRADSGFLIPDPGLPRTDSLIPDSTPLAPPDESVGAGVSANGKRKNGHSKAFQDGPAVIAIPLIGGKEYEVHQSLVDELDRCYPAVDALQTLREVRSWNLLNERERKTETGILRHINRWFAKEQNRG